MKKNALIVIAFVAMVSSAFAQDEQLSLSLNEAKQYAVSHNRTDRKSVV